MFLFKKVINPKWGIQVGVKFQLRGFCSKRTIDIKAQVLYVECKYFNRRNDALHHREHTILLSRERVNTRE